MSNKAKEQKPEVHGTFASSLGVFVLCVAVILFGIIGLGLDPHIPIIFATVIAVIYGFVLRIPFTDMESAMYKTIAESLPAMIIIMIIGILIASFMACGTVPYIIYLGLGLISPAWFLPFVILMCGLLSSITGSSWTTIGTIGVAFMGISIGLGIPLGITAAAVACGAFFGDKQSPVSDFVIFASGVSKVNIYQHCKNMLYTTGPAFGISTILFAIIGSRYNATSIDMEMIEVIRNGLGSVYHFSPLLWLPLITLIVTIICKMPAIPSLFLSALVGMVIAIGYQGAELGSVMSYLFNGFSVDTGIAEVDRILNRGGVSSMMYTLAIMMCSLAMAGVFERTEMLSTIVARMSGLVKNRFGLITTTLFTGIGMSYFAADPYIAALVPVKAFEDQYDKLGIDRTVLSRTISDSALTMCPIVPWGSSGIYTATALGVSVGTFFPFYFMGFLTPIFAMICAATGFGIKYVSDADKNVAAVKAGQVQ